MKTPIRGCTRLYEARRSLCQIIVKDRSPIVKIDIIANSRIVVLGGIAWPRSYDRGHQWFTKCSEGSDDNYEAVRGFATVNKAVRGF